MSPTQLARRHRLIKRAIKQLDSADITHEIHGAVGDPADAIFDAAEALPAEMIVVGGRGRSPVGQAMFGSTPQAVLLNATCPVVYVRRSND